MHRFYISPENWNPDALALTGSEGKLVLFNGRGREITAEIADLRGDRIQLRKLHEAETPALRCQIILGQAIPKGKNMDLIVQKAVEIGAAEIAPIISDRTVVQVDPESAAQKRAKWQQIAIEAAKQCGQSWLPQVHEPRSLGDRLASARRATFERNSRRLLQRTSTSSRKRVDACRARGRFHAGGACGCPPPWVPPAYLGPDYSARGNRRHLLPEHSLL